MRAPIPEGMAEVYCPKCAAFSIIPRFRVPMSLQCGACLLDRAEVIALRETRRSIKAGKEGAK